MLDLHITIEEKFSENKPAFNPTLSDIDSEAIRKLKSMNDLAHLEGAIPEHLLELGKDENLVSVEDIPNLPTKKLEDFLSFQINKEESLMYKMLTYILYCLPWRNTLDDTKQLDFINQDIPTRSLRINALVLFIINENLKHLKHIQPINKDTLTQLFTTLIALVPNGSITYINSPDLVDGRLTIKILLQDILELIPEELISELTVKTGNINDIPWATFLGSLPVISEVVEVFGDFEENKDTGNLCIKKEYSVQPVITKDTLCESLKILEPALETTSIIPRILEDQHLKILGVETKEGLDISSHWDTSSLQIITSQRIPLWDGSIHRVSNNNIPMFETFTTIQESYAPITNVLPKLFRFEVIINHHTLNKYFNLYGFINYNKADSKLTYYFIPDKTLMDISNFYPDVKPKIIQDIIDRDKLILSTYLKVISLELYMENGKYKLSLKKVITSGENKVSKMYSLVPPRAKNSTLEEAMQSLGFPELKSLAPVTKFQIELF